MLGALLGVYTWLIACLHHLCIAIGTPAWQCKCRQLTERLHEGFECLQVIEWAATYEHRLQEGQKAIFHLEAFVAKVMSVYKLWAQNAFGG